MKQRGRSAQYAYWTSEPCLIWNMKNAITHPKYGTLVANPNIEKIAMRGEDRILIYFPVKGKGLLRLLTDSESEALMQRMLPALNGESSLESLKLDDRSIDWLVDHGVLINKRQISQRVYYTCDLNYFLDLYKRKEFQRLGDKQQYPAILNPTIAYSSDGSVPLICKSRIPFTPPLSKAHTIWVEDSRTRLISPFRVSGQVRQVFELLYFQLRSTSILDEATLRLFLDAGILINRDSSRSAAAGRLRKLNFTHQILKQGYGILPDVFQPLQIKAMQDYYATLINEGWAEPNDTLVKNRYARYGDPLATFWHRQMGDLVSDLMKSPWRPSYTYVVSYRPGAILKRHLDRDQSELSVTVPIDSKPKVRRQQMWPLYLNVNNANRPAVKDIRVQCGIGDGVVYRNTKTFHYRKELPQGHSYTAIIFFFVPQEFKGPLN